MLSLDMLRILIWRFHVNLMVAGCSTEKYDWLTFSS